MIRMDKHTSQTHCEALLKHKIARLENRKRLLFKRTANHDDTTFKIRCLAIQKEARNLRLQLMRTRRNRNSSSSRSISHLPNEDNVLHGT